MRYDCDICGDTFVADHPKTRCVFCTHSEQGWRARIAAEQNGTAPTP